MNHSIGVDAYFLSPPIRGIAVSISSLVESLSLFPEYDFYVFVTEKSHFDCNSSHIHIIKSENCHPFIWYEFRLRSLLRSYNINSLILTSGFAPIFSSYPVSNIISYIHDISYLSVKYNPITLNAKFFLGRLYRAISFFRLLAISKTIVNVSESSKQDILEILPSVFRRNTTFHTLYNNKLLENIDHPCRPKKQRKLLLVSGPHPQKNIKVFFQALRYLPDGFLERWTVEIVAFNPPILNDFLLKHPSKASFVFTGHLNHAETLLAIWTHIYLYSLSKRIIWHSTARGNGK